MLAVQHAAHVCSMILCQDDEKDRTSNPLREAAIEEVMATLLTPPVESHKECIVEGF